MRGQGSGRSSSGAEVRKASRHAPASLGNLSSVSDLSESARCAKHPDLPAVGVCARCGVFLCAECKILLGTTVSCAACQAWNETKVSPLPVVPIALVIVWPLALAAINMSGGWGTVVAFVGAPLLAIPAVAMAFIELRRR